MPQQAAIAAPPPKPPESGPESGPESESQTGPEAGPETEPAPPVPEVVALPTNELAAPHDTPAVPAGRPSSRSEQRALGVCTLLATLAVIGIIWVASPVGIGLLLGTLTAFTVQPFYIRLRTRWRRPVLAALACAGGTTLTFALGLFGLGYLLVVRGIVLGRSLMVAAQPGGTLRVALERLGRWLAHLGLRPERLADQLGEAATTLSARLASFATVVAGATFASLLAMFFLILSLYFVLLNWSQLTRRAEIVLPLHPRDTRALFDEFRRVGRSVLLGTVLTGLAQGVLAGIGYYVTRVPEAAFLGALTAVASLLPGVGTLLVWVPAGIYLVLTGHGGLAAAELIYGAAVVVGISDYVLRPLLVGGRSEAPPLLTFIALFGGLEAFGLAGLIFGPVLMALALALLRLYEREATLRRAADLEDQSEGRAPT